MISTQKILTIKETTKKSHQLSIKKRPKIVARWKIIDGKLVCKWITS